MKRSADTLDQLKAAARAGFEKQSSKINRGAAPRPVTRRDAIQRKVDAINAFERELAAFGLALPKGGVVCDGEIHRLDDDYHHRKRNGDGWYWLRELPSGLLYGKAGSWWGNRGSFAWDNRDSIRLTAVDRAAIDKAKADKAAELEQRHRQAAATAALDWARAKPCTTHPYLTRKRVKSYGLRDDGSGRLLIPLGDLDGTIASLQHIVPAEVPDNKRFIFGTDRKGTALCYVIGEIAHTTAVVVVEGYATGATIHEATGLPVAVAFDAEGLKRIARLLRDRLPNATLIFAGDNDIEAKGGAGQKAAREAARQSGGVAFLPPIEGTDWNDHANGKLDVCEAHGLADVRARLIRAAGLVDRPATVTLDEGRRQLEIITADFIGNTRAWLDRPDEERQQVEPPAWLLNGSMGLGKSQIARQAAGQLLNDSGFLNDRGQPGTVVNSVPLHRLANEQAGFFKDETGRDVATWRGMDRDDPERGDGSKMCLQLDLSTAAEEAGVSVADVCSICPSRDECGYKRQRKQKSRTWYVTHQLLFRTKPTAIPAPSLLTIDEKFHDGGLAENVRLAASTLEGDLSAVPHAGDRLLLSAVLSALLIAIRTAEQAGKRTRLTKEMVLATGLDTATVKDAHRIAWTAKPDADELAGDVADMVAQLRAMAGRFSTKLPRLLALVEALLAGEHETSVNIEVEPNAKLQGGDGTGTMLHLHWRLDIHPSWRAPTLLLDGTAKPELVRLFFPHLHVTPEIHIEAPHQRVTWIRDSFSKARLVPSDKASPRRNSARRNNVEDLRRFIEAQAAAFRGGAKRGAWDVLVMCNKAVETLLRGGAGLPGNVVIDHFNNVRGSNDYSDVRAIIVIGRPLPPPDTIHRQAERLAGYPLPPDDAMVSAVRWSICEAELLQVVARPRGIRRTASNPLDVLLLGDTPLPLKVDSVLSWAEAQPHPLDLMAARGVMPDCGPDRPGYWPLVAAVLPDLYRNTMAAKDAGRSSRWDLSMSLSLIDISHRERWRAKPHGGRYSIPVLVDLSRLSGLATVLELSDGPTDEPPDRPPGVSRPAAPEPAPAPAIPPMGEAGPPIAADQAALVFSEQCARGREALAADAGTVNFPAVRARAREGGPMAGHGPRFMVGAPIDSPSQMPGEFLKSIKGAALSGPDLSKPVLWPALADLKKPEVPADLVPAHLGARVLAEYVGGIMHPDLAAFVRAQQRAGGISQERLAQLMDLSRPQLANALQGRFGLSAGAAGRLREALTALPVRAPDLFDLATQHEASP